MGEECIYFLFHYIIYVIPTMGITSMIILTLSFINVKYNNNCSQNQKEHLLNAMKPVITMHVWTREIKSI